MAGGRAVLISADLMFGSKVEAMVRAAGLDCDLVTGVPESGERDALWIVDLAQGDFAPEDVAGRGVPVLAFYAHVDDAIRQRALDAGVDKIVPRSRMAREGTALIAALARN